jgi:aerobic-type carbon monoxide dehydrogenase small subunit (CoxS/CutS family)
MAEQKNNSGLSRRKFLKGVGGGVLGTATLISTVSACKTEKKGSFGSAVCGPEKVSVSFSVNGKAHTLKIEPRITLLDALRGELDYTGTKRVCNRGQCGACTVIMNGRTVLACSMLAIDAEGADLETIEGLADGDDLHPVQESFVKHDALQCGFCTPGFIMSSVDLLHKNPKATLQDIKHGVSGNLCRCGTYPNIFTAVEEAAQNLRKRG